MSSDSSAQLRWNEDLFGDGIVGQAVCVDRSFPETPSWRTSRLRGSTAARAAGLRQQHRPDEPERVAGEFSDSTQQVSGREQEAWNGTHANKGSSDSARKEAAQKRPDRVSGEDNGQVALHGEG